MTVSRSTFVGPTSDTRGRISSPERQALERLAQFEAVSLSEAWGIALREALRSRGLPNVGKFLENAGGDR